MMLDLRSLARIHREILTRTEKKHFLLLSLLFLISSSFDIVGIGAIGYFLLIMTNPSILYQFSIINSVFAGSLSTSSSLILLGLIILTLFILKTFLSCLLQKKLISYCYTVGSRIRVQLMEQCLYAPYSYFISNHTSDLINRILLYANSYSGVSLLSFMTMLVHSTFVLMVITFLLVFQTVATVFLIILFSLMLLIYSYFTEDKLYLAGEMINTSSKKIVQSVQEGLYALKEVRVLSKENFFLDQIEKASVIYANSNSYVSIFQKLPFYFLESTLFIFIILLCIAELSVGIKVDSIIATCGVLVTAGVRLLPSLYQVAVSITSIQSGKNSLETIYHHLLNFNEAFNKESAWPKKFAMHRAAMHPGEFETIQLNKVSYCYPQADKNALDSITLTIRKGQSVGIIGTSGAGKSTLVDILLGLLTPTSGDLLLNGHRVSDRSAWVERFAYIPQSIYLLDATIKQNIVFGESEKELDQYRLKQSIKMAQLEGVIQNLPAGIDTVIGENGVKLSGGQRQRVALARAFYHEREIIVMDEATAALDNETEHDVVEALKQLNAVKTLIIIAHRYSSIKHCEIVYQLEQGKIINSGTFAEIQAQLQTKAIL